MRQFARRLVLAWYDRPMKIQQTGQGDKAKRHPAPRRKERERQTRLELPPPWTTAGGSGEPLPAAEPDIGVVPGPLGRGLGVVLGSWRRSMRGRVGVPFIGVVVAHRQPVDGCLAGVRISATAHAIIVAADILAPAKAPVALAAPFSVFGSCVVSAHRLLPAARGGLVH